MNDDFESKHMTAGADVRHRDKRVSRAMAAILAVPALFCWGLACFVALVNATSDKPLPEVALPFVVGAIGALGLMFAVMSLTFAVLRCVVTDRSVLVKYGLWGPEIELGSITSCKVVAYDWSKFGGFGIRRGIRGASAYVPGPGDVVEIVYGEGATRKSVQIGASDASRLCLEINHAREALSRADGVKSGEEAKDGDGTVDAKGAENSDADVATDEEAAAIEEAEHDAPRRAR